MTSGTSAIHLVVTCTNRKRIRVPEHLRLGSVRERRPEPRFATWTRRLSAENAAVPARDLYSGEHWRIATGLPSLVGRSATLWVCSAGYGLVNVEADLSPYAATFATGDVDSVGGDSTQLRQWWKRLAAWPGPRAGEPRSMVELAEHDPGASIVAVMSEAYLRACATDLHGAAGRLSDPERFAIIGPPRPGTELDELIVPVTARLRPVVGGSLHSLHVRAAGHLLTALGRKAPSRTRLQKLAQSAANAAPTDTSRREPGTRLSDDTVCEFIRRNIKVGPASATVLLRRLRDSGMSCEQSRFKRLYAETVGHEGLF